jgi:hypothetical protein
MHYLVVTHIYTVDTAASMLRCLSSCVLQEEDDIVIEYVPAPAPDIEELLQHNGSSTSRPPDAPDKAAEAAGDDAAAGGSADDEDAERGYGGLGLGATAGLGLGATAGLGLGFRKAEPEPEPPAADAEVS